MMKLKIKAIIFDFGDTLVTDSRAGLERQYGLAKLSKAKQQRYRNAISQSEMGKMTTRQTLRITHELLITDRSPKEIETNLVNNKKLFPTWKLAERLSKYYKVLILSNNQKSFPRKSSKALGINFLKFPWVNSAYVGMSKPNPNIYIYTLKRFGLKPGEAVFVDDQPRNILPAKKLGINTFRYKGNYKELVGYLKKLGVST